MAALTKAVRLTGAVTNISKLFNNLAVSVGSNHVSPFVSIIPRISFAASYSTEKKEPQPDPLMQFFDDPKNWPEKVVKHGRSWSKDELRIKSNEDLHKLWYILLKEKNMLLTMEQACKDAYKYFPSPERLDKVEDSMENLEDVVRERNQAYHYLETGEHGERPAKTVCNEIGMRHWYKMCQHAIPRFLHRRWNESHKFSYGGFAVRKFLRRFREKIYLAKNTVRRHQRFEVRQILLRFPNADREALKQKYPDIDVDRQVERVFGHRHPHYVPPESEKLP